jgi:phosphoglycolate phosphatase-like HAD superfamily hydrolase
MITVFFNQLLRIALVFFAVSTFTTALKLPKAMSNVRAVLWDVDGTLSDSSNLGFTSTLQVLKNNGIADISSEDYHLGTRYTTPDRFAWHVTGNPKDPIGAVLGQQFDELYVNMVSAETAGFYPGMKELLQEFKRDHKDDVVFGALSNACGDYVRAVLKSNNVDTFFPVQLGADEVDAPKPHPEGLLKCCKLLDLHPAQCVYIGDSPTDGQAAAAAGMHAIGVSWGSHPLSSLQKAFPIVAHKVPELQEHIAAFLSSSRR